MSQKTKGKVRAMLDLTSYICTACGHEFAEKEQPSRCPVCAAHGGCREFPSKATCIIAYQNDEFRRGLLTGKFGNLIGSIWLSPGAAQQGKDFMNACLIKIHDFNMFNEDNDPFGDHSYGLVTVEDKRAMWKFDYLDLARKNASPEPENPAVTHRLLCIFMPNEYASK